MYPSVGQPPDGERDLAGEAIRQRMRDLPSELAPPFSWDELQRRSQGRAKHGRRVGPGRGAVRHRSVAVVGFAAVLVLAAVVASRFNRRGPESEPEPERASARVDTLQLARPSESARAVTAPDALLAQASTAERWLASEPDAGPVVRVSTHLAVTHLEDSIASMDDLLNLERLQHARASRLRALQLQRAQLVDSLAQVRYAEILSDEMP